MNQSLTLIINNRISLCITGAYPDLYVYSDEVGTSLNFKFTLTTYYLSSNLMSDGSTEETNNIRVTLHPFV